MKARVGMFVAALILIFGLTGCSDDSTPPISENVPDVSDAATIEDYAEPALPPELEDCCCENPLPVGSVRIISGGQEHRPFENIHHAGTFGGIHASGIFLQPEDVADKLVPFRFEEDFRIVIDGEPWHITSPGDRINPPSYFFSKLIDGEWTRVLDVSTFEPYRIFEYVQNGAPVRIDGAECFKDLLEPGEYILNISVSWGNDRGFLAYQYLFRFIK